jgi:hypothetical protein
MIASDGGRAPVHRRRPLRSLRGSRLGDPLWYAPSSNVAGSGLSERAAHCRQGGASSVLAGTRRQLVNGAHGPFAFQQANIVGIPDAAIRRKPVRHAAKPHRFPGIKSAWTGIMCYSPSAWRSKPLRVLRRARSWITVGGSPLHALQ